MVIFNANLFNNRALQIIQKKKDAKRVANIVSSSEEGDFYSTLSGLGGWPVSSIRGLHPRPLIFKSFRLVIILMLTGSLTLGGCNTPLHNELLAC